MRIRDEKFEEVKQSFNSMRTRRRPMWSIMRELAATYLPYRHPWLLSTQSSEKFELNPYYITSEGLIALRTQTAGLMNGITSPTRPWFKLGVGVDPSRLSIRARKYLAQKENIMYSVMARSNYYNTKAQSYFDVGLFGISGSQIFEDQRDVMRMQRFNNGEFYVEYDFQQRLIRYGREFKMTLEAAKREFGEENLPQTWREQLRNKASLNTKKKFYHMVELNNGSKSGTSFDRFSWQEFYWTDEGDQSSNVARVKGYHEQPATFPRWSAELDYGNSPAMDALADMRELIQIILKKGVALEKMVDPPMLFDSVMQNMPKSTLPGGHSYVPNLGEVTGGRPAYTVSPPLGEMRADIQEVKAAIREMFHNDLFKMISRLETVRSATEIDARREEKLVLLAHFLERYENESLDPDVERIHNLCERADLFPDPPRELRNADHVDITYISILSTAQRAISTAPLERVLQLVGKISAVDPTVLDTINFDELVYVYGRDIAATPEIFRDREELAQRRQLREQQAAVLEATATAETAIGAAKTLGDTNVGGGANALQRLLG